MCWFTRLQREPIRDRAVGIDRCPDQPARELALQSAPDRDVAACGAVEQRDAETLGRTDPRYLAPLPRRRDQLRHSRSAAASPGRRSRGLGAIARQLWGRSRRPSQPGVWITTAKASWVCSVPPAIPRPHHPETKRGHPGSQHGQGLGQDLRIDDHHRALREFRWANGDGFGHCGPLVQQRGRRATAGRRGPRSIVWNVSSASRRPWLISG